MARAPLPEASPLLPLVGVTGKVPDIEDRYSPELVIALVGPVGSGVSTTAQILLTKLTDEYGYTGKIIRVSDVLNQSAALVGEVAAARSDPQWTHKLQNIGTKMREQRGNSFVADLVIGNINISRPKDQKESEKNLQRKFTIIDSIKHPSELHRLHHVYGQAFWLIGIFAPEEKRRERLSGFLGEPHELARVMNVDENESNKSGQKVRDTIFLSDYFIRNDGDNDESLKISIQRFLDVIFGISVQTPTRDESAMYGAASAASKTACLSRQVGAIILNTQGEVIGTGNNDVPKSGGGLYTYEDGKADNRCFKWKLKVCHNDIRKSGLKNQIIDSLISKGLLSPDKREDAEEIIFSTDIKQLIEFSRAVHAEMEAIISVARSGGQGIKGSTLYTTTYPCHSCARHIVAAGIDRVVYIEPYAKSLALDLHNDAIGTSSGEKKKVSFVQYEGMAPKNLLRIFRNEIKRKSPNGKALTQSRKAATPILREHVDDFERRERIVAGSLATAQKAANMLVEGAANEGG